jgi:galactokinase
VTVGVCVAAQPGAPGRIHVRAADLGQEDAFDVINPPAAGGWRAFVRGAVAELQRDGHRLTGAELSISGDVPRGEGLSSSAALEVAVCLALLAVAEGDPGDPIALARVCSRIENDWVGAHTGLLDQLASLCARDGHAVRIDFRTLELTQVPLRLPGHRLVTLHSGETHSLADSGYNDRRAECREACRRLGIATLREATAEQAAALPAPLDRRVRHVITENRRVDEAVAALQRGDMAGLGALLDASHVSLRDDYEVSTDAVEDAVARLHAAGALGARIVGGGFGGSVLALMAADAPVPAGAVEIEPGAGARIIG